MQIGLSYLTRTYTSKSTTIEATTGINIQFSLKDLAKLHKFLFCR